jgi:hypothetical protein
LEKIKLFIILFYFIFFYIGGWSPYWVQSALRPIVPALGDCEDGEVDEINGFGRGNQSTLRKPAPTPVCPPQIPLARPGYVDYTILVPVKSIEYDNLISDF